MNEKKALMDLDRKFCSDCQNGKEKAWASYFAMDGQMITEGLKENIVGPQAIEEAMKELFHLPELRFTWEPNFCEMADDGSLGVTRGTSILSYQKEGKTILRNGNYTTVWKKVNGEWKIAWDIGN